MTQDILDRYGLTFEWSLKAKIMGRKPLEAAKMLVDTLDVPLTPEEFHREMYGKLMDMFPAASLLPGRAHLLAHFLCLKKYDYY